MSQRRVVSPETCPPNGRHLELVPQIESSPSSEGVFISPDLYETEVLVGKTKTAGTEIDFHVERPVGVDPRTQKEALLILHGYGGIEIAYEDLRHYVAAHGLTAATIDPARNHPISSFLHPKHIFTPFRLTSKGANSVLQALPREFGIETVHLGGHSMGGYVGERLASHNPDLVKTLILIASAGMEEDLKTMDFVPRIPNFAMELVTKFGELPDKSKKDAVKQAVNYMLRNPLITIGEAIAVSNCDIRQDVKMLGRLGIKTASLQYPADSLLPPQNVDDYVDVSMLFPEEGIGHVGPQIRPQETGQYILDILNHFYAKAA